MKHSLSFLTLTLVSIGVVALFTLPARADNDPAITPYISAVNPDSAKPGGEIAVDGLALGKSTVSELYLTRGGADVKLEITSQKTERIAAKLPATLETGRYRLMVLTVGAVPRFIEQPVSLTVE